MTPDHKKLLLSTITKAGKLSLKYFRHNPKISHKGINNLVTEADHAVEKFIKETLSTTGYAYEAEESGGEFRTDEYRWIIDPIDGTNNFAAGIHFYNITIALAKGDDVLMGAVYDPVHDELFFAEKGKGAFLNGEKIQVRETHHNEAMLSCHNHFVQHIKKELKLNTRVFGSAALEIAYVACGRLQGCAYKNLHAWDFAAAALLVKEAGGKVSDISGDKLTLSDPTIIAGTKTIYSLLFEYLNRK